MKNRLVRNNKGFSLIELIVAVLILAIIAGGAIIAFGSIFSTQNESAAKNVENALRQARAYALAKENKEDTDGRTDVYAKFYYSGSILNIDVCRNDDDTVLYNQQVSGTPYKIKFYKVTGTSETEALVMGEDDVVRMYFKKSTGGISAVEKNVAETGLITGINKLCVCRASAEDSYKSLVLVELTGRCYVDN